MTLINSNPHEILKDFNLFQKTGSSLGEGLYHRVNNEQDTEPNISCEAWQPGGQ